MASLIDTVTEAYNTILDYNADPLASTFPLIRSPIPILSIFIGYMSFIFIIGPQLMKNRPAFNLKWVVVGYNAFQVVFNMFVFWTIIIAENNFDYLLRNCYADNPLTTVPRTYACWWYFISKVVELTDTIFFVLKKKNSHITFFHVYHHTFTMLFVWCLQKFWPGEQSSVLGILNSGVHVIMYTYYMLAALGPSYRKYLWWKKYMTMTQLIQFFLMFSYLVFVAVMDCNMSKSLTRALFFNCTVFIYLFVDFYRKEYFGNKKPQQQKLPGKAE